MDINFESIDLLITKINEKLEKYNKKEANINLDENLVLINNLLIDVS